MHNVISLFDGMSCGQIALNYFLYGSQYRWYTSEIDPNAAKVTKHNFPNTIPLGDIRFITDEQIKAIGPVFMVMGGSPCTDFSIAGKRKGMTTTENVRITSLEQYLKLKDEGFEFHGQSYLFWEYVRILKIAKPRYFLLENVIMKGKHKFWEYVITNVLSVQPLRINSSLVSAQNRDRLYWTNIPGVTIPEDREIVMYDVIHKAYAGYGIRGVRNENPTPGHTWIQKGVSRKDFKSNCLTKGGSCRMVEMMDGTIRPLTVNECEKLQTIPVGYTSVPGVSDTARFAMIGNGWTVEVIKHILSFIPKNEMIPQSENEEIIFLPIRD